MKVIKGTALTLLLLLFKAAAYAAVARSRGWCTAPSWMCHQNGASFETGSGRAFHAAVSLQRNLYIFGGIHTSLPHSISSLLFVPEPEVFQRIDATTWTLQTIRLAEGCRGPAPRSHFAFIPWRSRFLVMFGGQLSSENEQGSVRTTNSVWIYDTIRSLWADLCAPIQDASSCAGTSEANIADTICIDSFGRTAPSPRHSAAAVVVNDTLIVHGGQLLSGRYLSDIWFLDLKPALEAFQTEGLTCRTLPFYLRRAGPCAWQAENLSTTSTSMAGHTLGLWTGEPDMLLACGGTTASTAASDTTPMPAAQESALEHATEQQTALHVFNLQSKEWLPVWHADGILPVTGQQCLLAHSEAGLDLLLYSVSDPSQCIGSSADLHYSSSPSLVRYRVVSLSPADGWIKAEQLPGYRSSRLAQHSMLSCENATESTHEAGCPCMQITRDGSNNSRPSFILMLDSERAQDQPGNSSIFSALVPTLTTRQWQLPMLKSFAWAVTSSGMLFMDGGITSNPSAERSNSYSVAASASFLIGLNSTWVKPLRGGSESYAWAQTPSLPNGLALPMEVIPSTLSSPEQTASHASSNILLLDHHQQQQRMLLFVGRAVEPNTLQFPRWWTCLTPSPGVSIASMTHRPAYTSGNTLRFIEELPSTISDVALSSAWFSPSIQFVLNSVYSSSQCEQHKASVVSSCFSRQHTRVCAPMEPVYGAAVLSIPGHHAFVAFGGRAAVETIQDVPECSERLGSLAWRFQYHPQLVDAVRLDINGSTVDYQCLNQPLVGILQTQQGPAGERTSFPPGAARVVEPAAHAFDTGTHIDWARLLPFGLSETSILQLMHRSHHAMVHIQTAEGSSQVAPKLFLLWGGYGAYMSVLNDMWAVYIFAPGTCTFQASAPSSWWADAWCFTAFQIRQTGAVPPGRAYAKMAVLQERQEVLLYGGCQICSGDSKIEDPSGSDSLMTQVLDISQLLALSEPGTATVEWSLRPVLGEPFMPARKGHSLITQGCSLQDTESRGYMAPCTVLWYGGWNPRWSTPDTGHLAVQKLDASIWAWSMLPNEGTRDYFEETAARTQPSALCPIGDSHMVIMAAYFHSLIFAPMPVDHVAHVQSMPSLLQHVYAGDRIVLRPGVLEVQNTINVDVPWITLTAAGQYAEGTAHKGSTAAQSPSMRANMPVPLFTRGPDALSADFVYQKSRQFAKWTGSPQQCPAKKALWSLGGTEVVLSCVRMRRQGGHLPQAQPPLGTALNVTAQGLILQGMTVFGCVDTALEIWSTGNHIHETQFERNSGQIGGALMLAGGSSSSFSSCTFIGNAAATGSAIAVRPGALVDQISSCDFSGNWQQNERRDERTGRMIDPTREYNDRTLQIFADRMKIRRYEDTLVFQMTRQPATSTLGGTVDVFRSCVLVISNCSFCSNGVSSDAMLPTKGALVVESPACELDVVQTRFADNHVHTSGAAMLVQSAVRGTMPRLKRCIFSRNSAKQAGGALRIESVTGDMAVDACLFTDNWSCAGGGGISVVSGLHVFMRDSAVFGNSAIARSCVQGSSDMWTLSVGGGIWHASPSLLQLTNTSVMLNTAVSGGGIMASSASKVSIIGGFVGFNTALNSGGGLSCQGCSLLRSISLFYSNHAVQGAGMFVQPMRSASTGTGTDLFLDLSDSQDQLQSLSCYALFVAYFYSNSTYPLRCDRSLPLPFPTLSVAALQGKDGLALQRSADEGSVNTSNLNPECGGIACLSLWATSAVSFSDLQSHEALADSALCFAWTAHRVSQEDVTNWHLDKASPVLLLSTCFIANSAVSRGLTGLEGILDSQLISQASSTADYAESQCGLGNGGALCISVSLQSPIQVAKSLFWKNSASYGGGAYLSSGNTLLQEPVCQLLPAGDPIFLPVHVSDTAFVDNLCGPSQAGASVFWNTPYLLHISCSSAVSTHTPYQPGVSNCSAVDVGDITQRYCHQCVLVNGCSDWQGNIGGLVEPGDDVISQGLPVGPDTVSPTPPVVIIPIPQQRVADARGLLPAPGVLKAAHGLTEQRRLAVEPPRSDGMASGGVMLQARERVVAGYASGAVMNITVELLDAYGQVLNTDEFVATRPGAPLPAVSVSQGQGDVFLSGQLTQQFRAGIAELRELRFIGDPGRHSLLLESVGADPTFVEVHVRPCVMGEVFVSQRCVVCGAGTVAFGPHDEEFPGSCRTCPEGAQCYGSTAVVPRAGFAAISPLSTTMQRCPNPQACAYNGRQEQLREYAHSVACHSSTIGVDGTVTWTAVEACPVSQLALSLQRNETMEMTLFKAWMQSIPQCTEGYRGLLCGQCKPGFGQGQTSFTCTRCPSTFTSSVVLVAGVAAVLLVSWYTIHQASMTAGQSSTNGSLSQKAASSKRGPLWQLWGCFGWLHVGMQSALTAHPPSGRLRCQDCEEITKAQMLKAACLADQTSPHRPQTEAGCFGGNLESAGGAYQDAAAFCGASTSRGLALQVMPAGQDGTTCDHMNTRDMEYKSAVDAPRSPVNLHITSFGSPGPQLGGGSFHKKNSTMASPAMFDYPCLLQPTQSGPCAESSHFSMTRSAPPPIAEERTEKGYNVEFQVAKILISYLQVVSVIRDVDLRLPGQVQTLFQVQGSASNLQRMSAWDCYVLSSNILGYLGTTTPSAARVGLLTVSPFLFLLFWTLVWMLEALQNYQKARTLSGCLRHFGNRLIITCLCIAFLLCPMVIGSSLEIFSCISIAKDIQSASLFPFELASVNTGSYWALDTSLPCWIGEHRTLVLYIGIPGLLLWCAGVPLLFLGVLWRERGRLEQDDVCAYLGFLYLGYMPEHFYWEVIVILRKVAVVAVTTLVQSRGMSRLRLMLMLGVVWVALVMQVVLRPYNNKLLNRAEVVSLSATSATLYLCSFLVEGGVTSSPAMVALTSVVLAVNICVTAWFAAIITRVGTESFLKFIGAMGQHEKQLSMRHIKAVPRQAWVSASARWIDLRSRTFRSGRISSQVLPVEVQAQKQCLEMSTSAMAKNHSQEDWRTEEVIGYNLVSTSRTSKLEVVREDTGFDLTHDGAACARETTDIEHGHASGRHENSGFNVTYDGAACARADNVEDGQGNNHQEPPDKPEGSAPRQSDPELQVMNMYTPDTLKFGSMKRARE